MSIYLYPAQVVVLYVGPSWIYGFTEALARWKPLVTTVVCVSQSILNALQILFQWVNEIHVPDTIKTTIRSEPHFNKFVN